MNLQNNLTKQEKRILYLIAQGKQNKYIAEAIFLSEHTTKNHKANLCSKLNVKGTLELYLWASRNTKIVQQFQEKPNHN